MQSRKHARSSARVVLVAGIVAATLSAMPIEAGAASSKKPTKSSVRTINDPASGESVVITDEGNCGKTKVEVRSSKPEGFNDEDIVHSLDYAIDSRCNVVIKRGGTGDAPGSDESQAAEVSDASGTDAGEPGQVSAAAIVGNVIHSSQTMQDAVNIDIAKYQYAHDRVWDQIGYTYFKVGANWWMRSSTSVSWNHPAGAPASDGFDGSWTFDIARGFGHGDFHSDFLWCNFQPGQNFRMNTTLDSRWNGNYDAHFQQNRACGGTHMATRKWANTVRGV